MMSEDDTVSTAVLAEDAAVRANNLILALHRHGDAVVDGARRGVTEALSGQLLTMTRAEADRYAAAAASGAVAGALTALDNCLTGNVCTSRVKQDETTMQAALTRGTKTTSSANNSVFRLFVLASSIGVAALAVFAVLFRAV